MWFRDIDFTLMGVREAIRWNIGAGHMEEIKSILHIHQQ